MKFAWSGVAVVLAAALMLGIVAPQRAQAAAVTGTATALLSGNVWSSAGTGTYTGTTVAGPLTISEATVAAWTAADTIAITHTGLTSFAAAGAVCTNCTIAYGATTTTITITAVTAGTDSVSLDKINFIVTASGAAGSVTLTIPGPVTVGTISLDRMVLGWQVGSTTFAAGPLSRLAASFPADTFAAGGAICAMVANAAGAPDIGVPITFTVSLGVVSTGTAKSTTVLAGTNGSGCTNYRGGGNQAATDTAIASNSSSNIVSTLPITLTAPTGNTATKLAITGPTDLAIAPTITNVTPGYVSPKLTTNMGVQVTDSAGLGKNGEVLLISIDRGAIAAGNVTTCSGNTKAVTITSAAGTVTVGGDTKQGTALVTICGNQLDAAGKATITVQDVTTSIPNATVSLSMSGRPNKVEASSKDGSVTAKVTDAAGNVVPDGTVVQFTISSNAGAASNPCTTTTNGVANSAVSLNGATGTVIVTASFNETGTAAACSSGATSGSQTVSAVVPLPTGSSTGAGPAPAATGTATAPAAAGTGTVSAAIPASGFGLSVFSGGTTAQLVTASKCPAATAAFYVTKSTGEFVVYVPGTTIAAVNAEWTAMFPTSIPANTPFIGKCA